MSFEMIKYFFEMGVYSKEDVANYVNTIISEEEFHLITGYNYKAILK